MKYAFRAVTIAAALIFSACNNTRSTDGHEGHEQATETKDSMSHASAGDTGEPKALHAAFASIDPALSASVREIVDHYLHVKNSLAGDNAAEAANGAKAMIESISKLDKSLFTAAQKAAYDKDDASLKEHAGQIAKNGADIKLQRSHFVQLSETVYDLVKQFGGGRTLYHDHCPMARDNQGAMWISEIKEVRNPYFGEKMLTCGTIEEVIQ
jgi:hypothetical protein